MPSSGFTLHWQLVLIIDIALATFLIHSVFHYSVSFCYLMCGSSKRNFWESFVPCCFCFIHISSEKMCNEWNGMTFLHKAGCKRTAPDITFFYEHCTWMFNQCTIKVTVEKAYLHLRPILCWEALTSRSAVTFPVVTVKYPCSFVTFMFSGYLSLQPAAPSGQRFNTLLFDLMTVK